MQRPAAPAGPRLRLVGMRRTTHRAAHDATSTASSPSAKRARGCEPRSEFLDSPARASVSFATSTRARGAMRVRFLYSNRSRLLDCPSRRPCGKRERTTRHDRAVARGSSRDSPAGTGHGQRARSAAQTPKATSPQMEGHRQPQAPQARLLRNLALTLSQFVLLRHQGALSQEN